jgi:DNA-binding response OmpR family regulator
MPHQDGAELTRQLRALDSTLPIIWMSGGFSGELPLDKNSHFLKKPFWLPELSVALKTLPERARAGLREK